MESSPTKSAAIRSMLADETLAAALVPWACPCQFGKEQRYTLEELIATGRRSFVYKARDLLMSSKGFEAFVAVKITPPRPAAEHDALLARRVNHPNVLQVLDRGTDDSGATYVVTEWMDGGTLASAATPWEPRNAAALISKLARGVQASHLAGVIHCDLKPSNILFNAAADPKVADFDLAYAAALSDDQSQRGNLAFMSPEQFEDAPGCLAPAADVYALGGLLYWLLTGRPPHGESAASVLQFHGVRTPIAPLRIERDLDAICERALARTVEDRYQAAATLADDLDSWLQRKSISWTRPSLTRRARLFTRRNPARLAVAASLLIVASTGAAYAYDRTIGARLRDAETNQTIADKSQEEVNRLRETMKAFIRGVALSIHGIERQQREWALPSMFWLDWIRGNLLVDEQGRVKVPEGQISSLTNFVSEAQSENTDDHLHSLLERFALAEYLLDSDRPDDALKHLDRLEEIWVPKLAQNDPIRASLTSLRQGARLEQAAQHGEPVAPLVAAVNESLQDLANAGGSESVDQLLRRLVNRHEPRIPPPQ